MKVQLTRVNDTVRFLAKAHENYVYIDGPPSIGGEECGFRPTELLLCAVGSCASFDFASMLYKQGVELEDLVVEVEGERKQEGSASPFTSIHITFIVQSTSEISSALVDQFARKSVHELCSVGATLRKETTLAYTVEYR